MKTILPVASGKGGVGKSIFCINLSIMLALSKKKVILVDLDLGGSNLHTLLGIENTAPGIGNLIYQKGVGLKNLLIETEIAGLSFIPGNALFPGTSNLPFYKKQKILSNIKELEADYIIVDLGSGSSYNTVDFYLMATPGIIITNPEPTAILDAYYFLKTTLFRLFYRSFPTKSTERQCVIDYVKRNNEEPGKSFKTLIGLLARINPASGETAERQLKNFFARLVINSAQKKEDLQVGTRLREIISKNLGIKVEYIGFFAYDKAVAQSVIQRMPLAILYPHSAYTLAMASVVQRLIRSADSAITQLYEADEDLDELNKEATEKNFLS
jgi:flagellar biosynthesis protein FlhG